MIELLDPDPPLIDPEQCMRAAVWFVVGLMSGLTLAVVTVLYAAGQL